MDAANNSDEIIDLENYRLFMKGNANTPLRFFEYRVFHKDRPIDLEFLNKNDFIELDIHAAAKKHNGISKTLIKN